MSEFDTMRLQDRIKALEFDNKRLWEALNELRYDFTKHRELDDRDFVSIDSVLPPWHPGL